MPISRNIFWFYLATTAFAGGVFIRSFMVINSATVWWLLILSLSLIFIIKNHTALTAGIFLYISFTLLFIILGILRMEWASQNETNIFLESQLEEKVLITGVVDTEPEYRDTTTHVYIKTDYGRLLVFVPIGTEVVYGDELEVTGTLEKPSSFTTDLGREFNYRGYLLAKGVSYTVNFATIKVLSHGHGHILFTGLFTLKDIFLQKLELVLPEPQAGLGEGVLLGVSKSLGDDLEKVFRRAGIIHIVVLSGYNVMIVVTFILFVLGSILGRRASSLVGMVGIFLFAVLVGLGSTVVRACVMASLLLLMNLTGRIYWALRGLLVAGIAMILWNPYYLVFDIGFQLSFLATLGLILFSPYINSYLTLVPTFLGIREFLVATLATQLFVLPLLLYQIGELSIISVIVNVLVLPLVPLAMMLTFVTGIISLFSVSLGMWMGYLANLSLAYIIVIAKWFASLPFASFTVPQFPFWVTIVGYISLALWLWYTKKTQNSNLNNWQIVEESNIK